SDVCSSDLNLPLKTGRANVPPVNDGACVTPSILDDFVHESAYFLMMASSFFIVASGQRWGGVKIAFFNAEPHLQLRSARLKSFTAVFMMTWVLRTFLVRYSTT